MYEIFLLDQTLHGSREKKKKKMLPTEGWTGVELVYTTLNKACKIISHYKKIGYYINISQQTACLVVNTITVDNFAFLFNCTPAGWTSDSMTVLTKVLSIDEKVWA